MNRDDVVKGAIDCMAAMPAFLAAAEVAREPTDNDTAELFYSLRAGDALAFADSLGPMSPYARGVVMALAEYIHAEETTGTPCLPAWRLVAAMTPDELQREIDETARGMLEGLSG